MIFLCLMQPCLHKTADLNVLFLSGMIAIVRCEGTRLTIVCSMHVSKRSSTQLAFSPNGSKLATGKYLQSDFNALGSSLRAPKRPVTQLA